MQPIISLYMFHFVLVDLFFIYHLNCASIIRDLSQLPPSSAAAVWSFTQETTSTIDDHTAIAVNSLPTNTRTIETRQKDDTSRNLTWLTRPAHGAGEAFLGLLAHCARHQRRPNGSWSYGIAPDTLGHELIRDAAREGHYGALRARVIQQIRAADVGVDRGVVDDRAAGLHVLEGVFGHEELASLAGSWS